MTAGFIVNIDVPDLDTAARFYCEAFGLATARRLGPGVIELTGGPTPIYLLAKDAGSPATSDGQSTRSYRRHWTPVHLDFLTDDIDAALAKALAAGALLERGVRDDVWGRIALLADPFGNGLCLIQFLGRGYDEIAEPAA